MSTNLNVASAHAAVAAEASAGLGSAISTTLGRWLCAWRDAMALRRSLREISWLTDRELADIGLAHDEITRLRSSETFMPRGWRAPDIARGELPF